MIGLKCARIRLWSDFSDEIDLWPDQLQTMVQTVVGSNFRPQPVISVWEHTGVRSIGSDHKAIWVYTSTWEIALSLLSKYLNKYRVFQTWNYSPVMLNDCYDCGTIRFMNTKRLGYNGKDPKNLRDPRELVSWYEGNIAPESWGQIPSGVMTSVPNY